MSTRPDISQREAHRMRRRLKQLEYEEYCLEWVNFKDELTSVICARLTTILQCGYTVELRDFNGSKYQLWAVRRRDDR